LRLFHALSEEVFSEAGSSVGIKVPKIRNLRMRCASPVGIMFLVCGKGNPLGLL
jgi:hypothetical protein